MGKLERRRNVNRRRKRTKHEPRNFLVPVMRGHCKPGPHRDRRKDAARRACRVKLRPGVDGTSGLFLLIRLPNSS
jgi:hypothetical protein